MEAIEIQAVMLSQHARSLHPLSSIHDSSPAVNFTRRCMILRPASMQLMHRRGSSPPSGEPFWGSPCSQSVRDTPLRQRSRLPLQQQFSYSTYDLRLPSAHLLHRLGRSCLPGGSSWVWPWEQKCPSHLSLRRKSASFRKTRFMEGKFQQESVKRGCYRHLLDTVPPRYRHNGVHPDSVTTLFTACDADEALSAMLMEGRRMSPREMGI